ncbi:uncharacterized protein TRAVEDRAFT_70691 [Trametes versicolor FP-101664 SS1]|uniref:uncharacterized protein n=1 Tax=Trametes versicolor (strain FP-101664) TaxID=717944 RepID=UPI00046220B1|nr:uncharacterized protein TRAVEDRAFT_70691 [Trametes versicolor FP-101664 SS1]EIW60248.1 hypothetical protein TRAVEDRAFT_70691 [Trametes versicolor FP-101664 SS1]
MGQCWELVDLDGEVIVGDYGGGKLGEWFWENQWGIMDAFRVPVYGARVDELLQGPMTEQPACVLLRLVQDNFNLILDELAKKDYVALLCYAVTCKAALAGCREYIIAHQRRHCRPLLAGHRLVCIGEYANRPWKLPPEMLTDEEVDELEAYGRSHQELPCLFYYAQHYFDRLPSHELGFRSDDALRALDGVAYRRRRWHPQDWALVQSVARPCYPEDRPWALCNLLTLEYVREDAAVQLCESLPDNPSRWSRGEKERPTFWHFLLANICWSPDPTSSMPYNEDDLTQGRWAGDWFEVTLLENLRPASTDDENQWTDVTDEVGALVKRMWEAQVVNDNGRV